MTTYCHGVFISIFIFEFVVACIGDKSSYGLSYTHGALRAWGVHEHFEFIDKLFHFSKFVTTWLKLQSPDIVAIKEFQKNLGKTAVLVTADSDQTKRPTKPEVSYTVAMVVSMLISIRPMFGRTDLERNMKKGFINLYPLRTESSRATAQVP